MEDLKLKDFEDKKLLRNIKQNNHESQQNSKELFSNMENNLNVNLKKQKPDTKLPLHWIEGGLLIFNFTGPAASIGAPYAISSMGWILSIPVILISIIATVKASFFLVEIAVSFRGVQTLGDIAYITSGKTMEKITLIKDLLANQFLMMKID